MGFALIWHIWWMVALAALGAYATFVVFAWRDRAEDIIPADVGRAHRSGQPKRARRGARRSGGDAMSAFDAAAGRDDSHRVERDRRARTASTRGALSWRSKRIVVGYGFWIFLLSDIIMFSAFFATYAVLVGADGRRAERAGAVQPQQCRARDGLPAPLELHLRPRKHRRPDAQRIAGSMARWLRPSCLGAAFLAIEVREFADMIAQGAGPTRSAFLSAFFTLVGCHGLHVTAGLLWLLTMMAQVFAKGYRADILRRMLCFSLFWHALDIIWVGMFTVVYLMGVAP